MQDATQRQCLVIEPNALTLMLIVALLNQLGHKVYHSHHLTHNTTAPFDKLDLIIIGAYHASCHTSAYAQLISSVSKSIPIIAIVPESRCCEMPQPYSDCLSVPFDQAQLEQLLVKWCRAKPTTTGALAPQILAQLEKDVGPVFESIIQTAIEDGEVFFSALDEAVQAHDWPTLAAHAHAIKGSFSPLGALELVSTCKVLEQQAKTNRVDQIDSQVRAVYTALHDVIAELNALQKTRGWHAE